MPPAARALLHAAAGVLALAAACPAQAQTAPPDGGFSLPVRCALGAACWVMNYADVDPGPAARDFTCGPRTYQGHKGTDFAVRDVAAMLAGVPVVAIAPGLVLRRRDGVADRSPADARADAAGRECGNGVVIDHGGGWTSQYCHLRRNSIAVAPGARVARGARLGLVGLSGRTEFPHAHLSLRYRGRDLDPFTGQAIDRGCGAPAAPLWRAAEAPAYDPGTLYAAGFASGRITAASIRTNAASPDTLPATASALVLWGAIFGARAGDTLRLTVSGPDGAKIEDHLARLDRDRAWHIAFAGRKRPGAHWPPGIYRGVAVHRRGGRLMSRQTVGVTLR